LVGSVEFCCLKNLKRKIERASNCQEANLSNFNNTKINQFDFKLHEIIEQAIKHESTFLHGIKVRISCNKRTKITVNMFVTASNESTKISAETNKKIKHQNNHYPPNRQIIS